MFFPFRFRVILDLFNEIKLIWNDIKFDKRMIFNRGWSIFKKLMALWRCKGGIIEKCLLIDWLVKILLVLKLIVCWCKCMLTMSIGCSTVLIPTRVLQALQHHFSTMEAKSQSNTYAASPTNRLAQFGTCLFLPSFIMDHTGINREI